MNAVTVLIPTYNRASFLPRTLASVFRQTLPPDEVILIDDGSSDDTEQVVSSLLAQNPGWASRLRYVWQHNQGKSVALNKGLRSVRTEWIAFNDSDDTWMPEKLAQQFEALARFPDCLACFTETSLNEFNDRHSDLVAQSQNSFGKIDYPSRLYPIDWPGTYMQTVVVRADVIKLWGEFDSEYRLSQDVDFLFRLGLLTPFCYCKLALVEINRDTNRSVGLMTSFPPTSWTAMLEAESRLRKWSSLLDASHAELRAILKEQLVLARSALANRYIMAGDFHGARQVLHKGLKDAYDVRLGVKWLLAHTMPKTLRRFISERAPVDFLKTGETTAASKPVVPS